MVLRGCGKLRGAISYSLANRSSQMNAEAANDVDPKYYPRSIVSVQLRVADVWVGVMWTCILIFVWLRGNIRVGEWCCEVLESCKVQQGCEVRCYSSSPPDKNLYVCLCVCVCHYLCVSVC